MVDYSSPISGAYLAGFTEADGCFQLNFQLTKETKLGFRFSFIFSLTQSIDNAPFLEAVKKYLRVGKIHYRTDLKSGTKRADYIVKTQKSIHDLILPYFAKHRLIGEKLESFVCFRVVFDRIYKNRVRNPRDYTDYIWFTIGMYRIQQSVKRKYSKAHWLSQIENFYCSKNLLLDSIYFQSVVSDLEEEFTKEFDNILYTLDKNQNFDSNYVLGLTQGDGCFSTTQEKDGRFRWNYIVTSVLHKRSEILVDHLINFFSGGEKYPNVNDHVLQYKVQDQLTLESKVVPFFDQHSLGFRKEEQFRQFQEKFVNRYGSRFSL